MKSLLKYSQTSPIMKVRLKFGEEVISFMLGEEAAIDENRINRLIINQPRIYGFLTMLHKKLIKAAKDKERQKKRMYDLLLTKYKGEGNNDYIKAKAGSSKRYQEVCKALIEAEGNRDEIEACVKAMEMRAFLLQSLSANLRKERN